MKITVVRNQNIENQQKKMKSEESQFSADVRRSQFFDALVLVGAALLAERGAHRRLAAIVRMDDETSWIGELTGQQQNIFFLETLQLLALLCERSRQVREDLRKELFVSNGFMDLLEAMQEHGARKLRQYHGQSEDADMLRFPSLDCKLLSRGCEGMLRAVVDMFYQLFRDDTSDVYAAMPGTAASATELSGSWCTAMFLGNRRVDGIPGNWQLEFSNEGTVTGSGSDAWGDFAMSGTWRQVSPSLALLRKQCDTPHRRYTVDLLAFIVHEQADNQKTALTMRGLWLFMNEVGGFWAWQAPARELHMPAAQHQDLRRSPHS
eukprot:TRINITY_DN57349_c0_g1_i1.p1 TRINITY_DN57349_c0_g1~~TRINITY_DN57349_c0_g1_i1.p1  ORF type:complete len:321 (-),score=76.22 TRINITY_DN57349_c0_g1_i1:33-995(-)